MPDALGSTPESERVYEAFEPVNRGLCEGQAVQGIFNRVALYIGSAHRRRLVGDFNRKLPLQVADVAIYWPMAHP